MEVRTVSPNITDPGGVPPSEGSVEAVRAMTIEALVAEGPASVRLCNTIERGVLEGNMPCTTVGEYLDAGPAARSMFMTTLWAFGKGTANELEALIAAYLERCTIMPSDCVVAIGARADGDDALCGSRLPVPLRRREGTGPARPGHCAGGSALAAR